MTICKWLSRRNGYGVRNVGRYHIDRRSNVKTTWFWTPTNLMNNTKSNLNWVGKIQLLIVQIGNNGNSSFLADVVRSNQSYGRKMSTDKIYYIIQLNKDFKLKNSLNVTFWNNYSYVLMLELIVHDEYIFYII